jgi:hypothetical protein
MPGDHGVMMMKNTFVNKVPAIILMAGARQDAEMQLKTPAWSGRGP